MRDNGPLLNSGHTYPSPLSSPTLPPKSMLYFGPSSLSFTTRNIDLGVGDLRHLNRMK